MPKKVPKEGSPAPKKVQKESSPAPKKGKKEDAPAPKEGHPAPSRGNEKAYNSYYGTQGRHHWGLKLGSKQVMKATCLQSLSVADRAVAALQHCFTQVETVEGLSVDQVEQIAAACSVISATRRCFLFSLHGAR